MKLRYGEPFTSDQNAEPVSKARSQRHLMELAGISAVMDVVAAASCQVGKYGEPASLGKSLAVTAGFAREMVDRIRADLAQGEREPGVQAEFERVQYQVFGTAFWGQNQRS